MRWLPASGPHFDWPDAPDVAAPAPRGSDMAAVRPGQEPSRPKVERPPPAGGWSWGVACSLGLHLAALTAVLVWPTPVAETPPPESVTVEIIVEAPAPAIREAPPPPPAVAEAPLQPVEQESPLFWRGPPSRRSPRRRRLPSSKRRRSPKCLPGRWRKRLRRLWRRRSRLRPLRRRRFLRRRSSQRPLQSRHAAGPKAGAARARKGALGGAGTRPGGIEADQASPDGAASRRACRFERRGGGLSKRRARPNFRAEALPGSGARTGAARRRCDPFLDRRIGAGRRPLAFPIRRRSDPRRGSFGDGSPSQSLSSASGGSAAKFLGAPQLQSPIDVEASRRLRKATGQGGRNE